jgi:large subunit ribosomal protein L15
MILQMHTIKPAKGSRKKRRIVGRGNASGRGNYSGRGGKGQRARSGGKSGTKRKGFKFLLQSTPKLRGAYNIIIHKKTSEVSLADLDKKYTAGEVVNLASLKEKGLVRKQISAVKILASGELTKKLVIENIACTKKAIEMIKKVGGEVKIKEKLNSKT